MPRSLPPLVDVTTLADHLRDPDLRLFDATVELVRPLEGRPYAVRSGRTGYEEAHLRGAAFADIAGDLSDPESPVPVHAADGVPAAAPARAGAQRGGGARSRAGNRVLRQRHLGHGRPVRASAARARAGAVLRRFAHRVDP